MIARGSVSPDFALDFVSMARRAEKRRDRRHKRGGKAVAPNGAIDPLDGVVEFGGDLYFVVDWTPAGFPIGPRVEIVDGEMRFLDDGPDKFIDPNEPRF
jgi:hypothetical protein